MENKSKWYALRVVSGKERKSKEFIDKEVEKNESISRLVHNVVLPIEKVYKIRNGKKYSTDRNFYPGYILIETDMSGEVQHTIENLPNVMYFLKEGKKPIALRPIEVNRMLSKVDELKDQTDFESPFILGESVQITDGPFASFYGVITNLDEEKKKVKLNVKIFGRETPLEMSFLQIDKV